MTASPMARRVVYHGTGGVLVSHGAPSTLTLYSNGSAEPEQVARPPRDSSSPNLCYPRTQATPYPTHYGISLWSCRQVQGLK
jgi:hypothetical protein